MSDDLDFSGYGAEFICSLTSKRRVSSVLGTILGTGDTAVSKTPKPPPFRSLLSSGRIDCTNRSKTRTTMVLVSTMEKDKQ